MPFLSFLSFFLLFFESVICPFILYLNEMLIFVLRTRGYMLSKDDKGGKEGNTTVVQTASRFSFFFFFLFSFYLFLFTCQKELGGSLNYTAVFVIQPIYLILRFSFFPS
jgi:hypothetical protein